MIAVATEAYELRCFVACGRFRKDGQRGHDPPNAGRGGIFECAVSKIEYYWGDLNYMQGPLPV